LNGALHMPMIPRLESTNHVLTRQLSRCRREVSTPGMPSRAIRVISNAETPETTVLSPHEFAVLLLVNDSVEPHELDSADVEALIEHKLVTLEGQGLDHIYARVTAQGRALLKAFGHARSGERRVACVH